MNKKAVRRYALKKINRGDIYLISDNGELNYYLITNCISKSFYITVPIKKLSDRCIVKFHKKLRNKNFTKNTYILFEELSIKKVKHFVRYIDNINI